VQAARISATNMNLRKRKYNTIYLVIKLLFVYIIYSIITTWEFIYVCWRSFTIIELK